MEVMPDEHILRRRRKVTRRQWESAGQSGERGNGEGQDQHGRQGNSKRARRGNRPPLCLRSTAPLRGGGCGEAPSGSAGASAWQRSKKDQPRVGKQEHKARVPWRENPGRETHQKSQWWRLGGEPLSHPATWRQVAAGKSPPGSISGQRPASIPKAAAAALARVSAELLHSAEQPRSPARPLPGFPSPSPSPGSCPSSRHSNGTSASPDQCTAGGKRVNHHQSCET